MTAGAELPVGTGIFSPPSNFGSQAAARTGKPQISEKGECCLKVQRTGSAPTGIRLL